MSGIKYEVLAGDLDPDVLADALEAQGRKIERLNGACKSYEIQANRDALRIADLEELAKADRIILDEAEALLREASIHLRYHDVAAGLREMIDAFLGRDKP